MKFFPYLLHVIVCVLFVGALIDFVLTSTGPGSHKVGFDMLGLLWSVVLPFPVGFWWLIKSPKNSDNKAHGLRSNKIFEKKVIHSKIHSAIYGNCLTF